jgi:hypothetical protein
MLKNFSALQFLVENRDQFVREVELSVRLEKKKKDNSKEVHQHIENLANEFYVLDYVNKKMVYDAVACM